MSDIIKPDFEKIKELRTLLDEEVKYIDHWLLEGGMGLVRSAQMRERKEFILMSLNRTVDLESTFKRLQEENEQLKEEKKELVDALNKAKPYVYGAYECAFPDESENDYVKDCIEKALNK